MIKQNKRSIKIVNSNINLIHWNCNSLNNKIEEFKSFCLKFNPQLISLNETKMSAFNAKYILEVNNYSTIHRSRNNDKNGAGGVALLIRNDLKLSECI
jgi:exonuclease III